MPKLRCESFGHLVYDPDDQADRGWSIDKCTKYEEQLKHMKQHIDALEGGFVQHRMEGEYNQQLDVVETQKGLAETRAARAAAKGTTLVHVIAPDWSAVKGCLSTASMAVELERCPIPCSAVLSCMHQWQCGAIPWSDPLRICSRLSQQGTCKHVRGHACVICMCTCIAESCMHACEGR